MTLGRYTQVASGDPQLGVDVDKEVEVRKRAVITRREGDLGDDETA